MSSADSDTTEVRKLLLTLHALIFWPVMVVAFVVGLAFWAATSGFLVAYHFKEWLSQPGTEGKS